MTTLGTAGFTGGVTDRLISYCRLLGDTRAGCIADAEYSFLLAQGATFGGHVDDLWFAWLGAAGYTGDLVQRKTSWWADSAPLDVHTPRLSLESGFTLLLESGDKFLLE